MERSATCPWIPLTQDRWPAIIGIVVGSLIVISIVWCLARCLCCGLSCCCDCFRPRGRRNNGSKYADGPSYNNAPYMGGGYQPAPAPPSYEPPRFAQFDTPSKPKPDSLPAMPTWDQATSRKVEDTSHGQDVEMDHLENRNGQMNGTIAHQGPIGRGGYSQVPSAPPTPNDEQQASYRGSEVTNPYATTTPTAYGTNVNTSYPPASPPYSGSHQMNPVNSYQRMSPPPAQGNFGGYGQGNSVPSPYHDQPPGGAFNNSHSTYLPPASGTQAPRDYSAYTPTSTHYEPATSPTAANRPPSLLQPGRNLGAQTFREV